MLEVECARDPRDGVVSLRAMRCEEARCVSEYEAEMVPEAQGM